tara:strand:- start:321 stop:626 length:306 start_codon:yes stop_codon:yes gene_type:complete
MFAFGENLVMSQPNLKEVETGTLRSKKYESCVSHPWMTERRVTVRGRHADASKREQIFFSLLSSLSCPLSPLPLLTPLSCSSNSYPKLAHCLSSISPKPIL